jgi:hypothetical protein
MKLARNVTPRWSASASKGVPLAAVVEPVSWLFVYGRRRPSG